MSAGGHGACSADWLATGSTPLSPRKPRTGSYRSTSRGSALRSPRCWRTRRPTISFAFPGCWLRAPVIRRPARGCGSSRNRLIPRPARVRVRRRLTAFFRTPCGLTHRPCEVFAVGAHYSPPRRLGVPLTWRFRGGNRLAGPHGSDAGGGTQLARAGSRRCGHGCEKHSGSNRFQPDV